MNRRLFSILFACMLAAPSAHAGDARDEFVVQGKMVLKHLKSFMGEDLVKEHALNVVELEKALDLDRIRLVEGPLRERDGSPADAVIRDGKLELDRSEWEDDILLGKDSHRRVFGEMLRLAYASGNAPLSAVVGIPAPFGPPLNHLPKKGSYIGHANSRKHIVRITQVDGASRRVYATVKNEDGSSGHKVVFTCDDPTIVDRCMSTYESWLRWSSKGERYRRTFWLKLQPGWAAWQNLKGGFTLESTVSLEDPNGSSSAIEESSMDFTPLPSSSRDLNEFREATDRTVEGRE